MAWRTSGFLAEGGERSPGKLPLRTSSAVTIWVIHELPFSADTGIEIGRAGQPAFRLASFCERVGRAQALLRRVTRKSSLDDEPHILVSADSNCCGLGR